MKMLSIRNKYRSTIIIFLKRKRKIKEENLLIDILQSTKVGPASRTIYVIGVEKYASDSDDDSIDKLVIYNPIIDQFGDRFTIKHIEISDKFDSIIKQLVEIVNLNPRLIIISEYNPDSVGVNYLSNKIWNELKILIPSTKILICGWDTLSSGWWRQINHQNFASAILLGDNPLQKYKKSDKTYPPIYRFTCDIYRKDFKISAIHQRAFDIWFVGQVGSYRLKRLEYLQALEQFKTKKFIYLSTSRSNQISHKEYLDTLDNSKIAINFSKSHAFEQIKGRVWDIFNSGTFLLEEKNVQTSYFFKPGIDYWEFSDPEELIDKIKYLLANPEIICKVASNGRKKFLSLKLDYSVTNIISSFL